MSNWSDKDGYSFSDSSKENTEDDQLPFYLKLVSTDLRFYTTVAAAVLIAFSPSIYAEITEPMVDATVTFDNPEHSSDIYVMKEQEEDGFFSEMMQETYYVVATENQRAIYKDLRLNPFTEFNEVESERAMQIGEGEYFVQSYSQKEDIPGMYEEDWVSWITVKDPSHGGVELREGELPDHGKLKVNQSEELGWNDITSRSMPEPEEELQMEDEGLEKDSCAVKVIKENGTECMSIAELTVR